MGAVPTVMSCVRAPPSLQPAKSYVSPSTVACDGAVIGSCDPSMTSSVNGAVAVSVPSVRATPAGSEASVIGTVRGSSRRVTVRLSP